MRFVNMDDQTSNVKFFFGFETHRTTHGHQRGDAPLDTEWDVRINDCWECCISCPYALPAHGGGGGPPCVRV
jgi:hypothetical protein